MNTWQLAEDFRKAFEDSGDFEGDGQLHGQGDGDFVAPCEVFLATEAPFSSSGKAAKITLTVEVHSLATVDPDTNPDPDAAHGRRVAAVVDMLLESGKERLQATLNGLARWDIRGWSALGEDPTVQGNRFFTPVRIAATVIEL